MNRTFLLALAYVSLFAFGLIDNIRGPFLPELNQTLGLSGTTSSLYFSLASLAAFVATLLSPSMLHRWGSLRMLMAANFFMSFAFAVLSQAANLAVLLLGSIMLGVALGCLNLAQNVLVGEVAQPTHRRRIYSGLHSMYGLAAFLAPVFATFFRSVDVDWRASFLILSTLPFGAGVIAFFIRKSSPPTSDLIRPRLNRKEMKSVLLIALFMAGYLFGEISMSTRFVLLLRSERGFSADQADLYLALFSVLLLVGRVIFTVFHFPWRSEIVMRVSALVATVFYGLGLVYSPIWMALSGAAMAPFFPVAMDYISERFGAKTPTALSVILSLGSLSIVVMHTGVGVISDWQSLSVALWLGPLGMALAFLLTPRDQKVIA